MLQFEYIKNFFPPDIRDNRSRQKYIIKEYLQLLILDYLTTTPYLRKIVFIGGTYLRLVKGIDRFSEELKKAFEELLLTVDLSHKAKDFEHLVFHEASARKILLFKDFVSNMGNH